MNSSKGARGQLPLATPLVPFIGNEKSGRMKIALTKEDGEKVVMYKDMFVLECKLGRSLLPHEECEHINGDVNCDHMDNLRVRDKTVCVQCGVKAEKLMKCGRCYTVRYCSTRCQHAAWPTHKQRCVCLT